MADKLVIPFRGAGKLSTTALAIYDQFGNASALNVATDHVDVTALKINGVTLDATIAALTAAEIAFLDGATAGTQVASKAVVADANVNTGISKITELHIGASGAETQVTATGAELNTLDQTTQTETVASAGAIDITINHTALDSTAGTFAATLAAPGADMLGKVKTIEMTVDNGDVTIALTNVIGGSAATTCTFANINEALVLVGGTNKWHVIAESGVVLT